MGKKSGKVSNKNVEQSGDLTQLTSDDKLFDYNGEKLKLHVSNYPASPMAMSLYLTDPETDEMYSTLSVNLGNYQTERPDSFVQHGTTYLDTNNNPDVLELLKDRGLAEPYTCYGSPQYGYSGFCEYPLVQLNMSALAQYDAIGVKEYSDVWQKECVKEQQKMNERMFGFTFDESESDNTDDFVK